MILEACVETLEDAIEAEQAGAHQLELCSDLANDGLTPSESLISAVVNHVQIPTKIMIRPRSGNFIYTTAEIVKMKNEIQANIDSGVSGFVFGCAKSDGTLDLDQINELASIVNKQSITVHKVIDQCPDPVLEVKRLKESCPKVNFVLSSGGAYTAWDGIATLSKMQQAGENKIEIIAAGSITNQTLDKLYQELSLSYYHGRRIVH